mgnify:FL=1
MSLTTKALARQLIKACGGLEEAASACGVGKSQLGRYQDPAEPSTMTAAVIADLEAYCGSAIYSGSLLAAMAREAVAPAVLRDEAEEAVEATAGLQAAIRLAMQDGTVSPRERDRLRASVSEALRQLGDVARLIDREVGP